MFHVLLAKTSAVNQKSLRHISYIVDKRMLVGYNKLTTTCWRKAHARYRRGDVECNRKTHAI